MCEDCSRRKYLIPHVDGLKESKVCNDCYFFLISGASVIFEETLLAPSSANKSLSPSSTGSAKILPDSNFELNTFFKFKQEVQDDIQRNMVYDDNMKKLRETQSNGCLQLQSNDDSSVDRNNYEDKNMSGILRRTLSSSSLFTGRSGSKSNQTKIVTAESKCSVCSTEFSLFFKKKQTCQSW